MALSASPLSILSLDLAKSQKAVENREKWRKLVAKSFVVPQLSSRLRDRLEER